MTKNYLSSLAMMATAAMAVAQVPSGSAIQVRNNSLAQSGHPVTMIDTDAISNSLKPLKEEGIMDPQGNKVSYIREAYTYYEMMGGVFGSYTDSFTSYVVFDGNDVYVQNPISEFPTGGYMKGTLDGDKITFSFPQSLGYYQDTEVFINMFNLEWTDDEHTKVMYFKASGEENSITFTLAEDGTLYMPTADNFDDEVIMPSQVLGLNAEDGYWAGYAEWDAIYSVNKNVAVTRPENVTFEDYQMRYYDIIGQFVSIGFDGDKVYLSNLSPDFPDACAVGTLKDNKVTFETGQYLGVDKEWNENCFFWTYYMEWGYDDYYGYEGWLIRLCNQIEMNLNPDTKTLTCDKSFLLNLSNTELCYTVMFNEPVISPKAKVFIPCAPENPIFDQVDEYNPDEYYGYARMAFSLPMFNVKDQLMNLENVYYNVYFGDQLYTFEPDKFIYLTEPMTDIPYLFTDLPQYNGYEIKAISVSHIIYFDDQPDIKMNEVGVQSVYKDEDGNLYKSDLIYYQTGAVENVFASGDIQSIEYTDLTGKSVAAPEKGIYIKTAIMSDGSRKSTKVIMK